MTTNNLDDILKQLAELQNELEQEIDTILTKKRQQFRYSLEQGKVQFEKGMQTLQRYHKVGIIYYLRSARLGHILTAPIIYSLLLPFLLMDITVTFYQIVCFWVYDIPRVKRKDFFIIDRQQLAYLNLIEKFNCVYCGYCNGVIEYIREVAGRTEQYWCPVKHARRTPDPHRYVENFVDYGDAETYKKRLKSIQADIVSLNKSGTSTKGLTDD